MSFVLSFKHTERKNTKTTSLWRPCRSCIPTCGSQKKTTSQLEKLDYLRSTWTQYDTTVSYLSLNDLRWLEVGCTSVQLQSHSFTLSILTLRLPLNRFVVNQSPSAGRLRQFWQTISRACKHMTAKHLHSITSWKLIGAFALGLPFPSLKHKHCGWGGPAYIDCCRAPTSSTFSHSLTRGATELNTDDCRRVLHIKVRLRVWREQWRIHLQVELRVTSLE